MVEFPVLNYSFDLFFSRLSPRWSLYDYLNFGTFFVLVCFNLTLVKFQDVTVAK
uniref:Ion_trans domain-containing protein n=1 Tax=Mesocestoides corti TaxID=53468 RepID=A0A5K3EKJ9_MESCO